MDQAMVARPMPAHERLRASLTTDQWRLFLEADSETSAKQCEHEEILIEELARHLPGLAPAIRVIGQHFFQQKLAERGVCCAEEA